MNKSIFIALALGGVFIFSGFQYWSLQRYNRIYNQYSENIALGYSQRAVSYQADNQAVSASFFSTQQQKSLVFTTEHNYNQALALLDHEDETGDLRNDFLLGLNFLQKNELSQADFHLKTVATQLCPLQQDAQFLLALSALRSENPEIAKKYLLLISQSENNFTQRAQHILKQL
jgi:hypothetical protein